jgi:hypothetical protein
MTSGHSVKAEDAVIVPAGTAAAPRFNAARRIGREYYELLSEYFAPLLASSGTVPTALGRSPRSRGGRAA